MFCTIYYLCGTNTCAISYSVSLCCFFFMFLILVHVQTLQTYMHLVLLAIRSIDTYVNEFHRSNTMKMNHKKLLSLRLVIFVLSCRHKFIFRHHFKRVHSHDHSMSVLNTHRFERCCYFYYYFLLYKNTPVLAFLHLNFNNVNK